MLDTNRFYRLKGGVRHYAWGEKAEDGKTPYLAGLLGVASGTEPWAEWWLGTHPGLPSTILLPEDGSEPLLETCLAEAPAKWLGKACADSVGHLPFLLKVLTCSRPLSIQSHPDAKTAARLHAERPEMYPDANDKTEIIIALKPFEAMAGFRPLAQVLHDLQRIHSLAPWLQRWKDTKPDALASLKGACSALFAFSATEQQDLLNATKAELTTPGHLVNDAEALFLKLLEENPGDIGTLFAFLLNHWHLSPGEACFLPPNSPHAYLKGVGVECMSNSDNVIRAGLTPKAIDVPTLLATLNFQRSGVQLLNEEPIDTPQGGTMADYAPPTKNFRLRFLKGGDWPLENFGDSLSMLLILDGEWELRGKSATEAATRGSAWIRPAALTEGTLVAKSPEATLVLASPNF